MQMHQVEQVPCACSALVQIGESPAVDLRQVRNANRSDDAMAELLRRAIECGAVRAHYQPEVDLRDGSLVGVEALARWYEPRVGQVPPMEFVALAERHGLILDLTECMLEQVAQCSARAFDRGAVVPLSLNVSAASVNEHLVALLCGALDSGRIGAHQLTIELTETARLPGDDAAKWSLACVHRAGIRLSIDDFGMGWSSLGHLAELPVAEIKIDRSFVQKLPGSYEVACIIRRTAQLAEDLGIVVVAEGVEDEAQRAALLDLGCRRAQGYLMARPMAEHELLDWLQPRDSSPGDPAVAAVGGLAS